MRSRLPSVYISYASLAAICIICVYVIYAGDVISLRHVVMTAWQYVTKSRTDILCSNSGITTHFLCRQQSSRKRVQQLKNNFEKKCKKVKKNAKTCVVSNAT